MKKVLLFSALIGGVLMMNACGGKEKDPEEDDIDLTQAEGTPVEFASYTSGDSTKNFGKAITADGATNVYNLAGDKEKADGFTGKITGTVVSVCQNKGCWMKLDTGNGQTMMVTFKDYGFFVPKNIAGQTVVIEGSADMKTVSVDEQKHYLQDAGKPQSEIDAITEPKVELSFVADGVLLVE